MADRLAVSTNTYHSYSFEEALAGISAAGFTSVELSSVPGWTEHIPRHATEAELDIVKDQLARYSLEAVSLSGHSDLTSNDGVAEFKHAIRIASYLGIRYLTTSTGGHDDSSSGTLDEQRAAVVPHIQAIADLAAHDDIEICLETHGGISATGVLVAKLIEVIDRPNVGINYDTANVIFYGSTRPETDIAAASPFINHLHIKDQIGGPGVWNFPTIGTGEVDFAPVFQTLKDVRFTGPCSIELEFQGEPWPPLEDVQDSLAKSLTFLRDFLPAQQLGT
ncbi:MAG: sugar phosphate isomerase/epimerase family protein [Thermomicrobiales bacterium]